MLPRAPIRPRSPPPMAFSFLSTSLSSSSENEGASAVGLSNSSGNTASAGGTESCAAEQYTRYSKTSVDAMVADFIALGGRGTTETDKAESDRL